MISYRYLEQVQVQQTILQSINVCIGYNNNAIRNNILLYVYELISYICM